jgi:hypothetical protein
MGDAVYFLASPGHAIPVEEKKYSWKESDEPEGFSRMGDEKVSVKAFRQGNIVQKCINPTIEQGVSDETARIDSHSVFSAHSAKGFAITVVETGRADEFAL